MKRVHHHRPHENQFCHWPSLVDLRMSDRGTEYYRCVFAVHYIISLQVPTIRVNLQKSRRGSDPHSPGVAAWSPGTHGSVVSLVTTRRESCTSFKVRE